MTSFNLQHKREQVDTAEDILLLLYLLKRGGNNIAGSNTLEAKLKLMKLVFLAEKEMVERKMKGFNFFFNVFKKGPSSYELLHLLDDLKSQELIDFDFHNHTYSLTEKGRSLISEFEKESDNSEFFSIVSSTIDKYAGLSIDKLLRIVYSMKMRPLYGKKEIEIGKAVNNNERIRLLMRLQKKDTTKELDVPNGWMETINILMNPSFTDLTR